MITHTTPVGRDEVKKALGIAINKFVEDEGLRLIRDNETPIAGVTAMIFNINTRTGKALIELHQVWSSRGRDLTTANMKMRAADVAGVSCWHLLPADQKKEARAKWFSREYATIQL